MAGIDPPMGSQLARFSHKNPCRLIEQALVAKGYLAREPPVIAALRLDFPLGCHWELELSNVALSIACVTEGPERWLMSIRPDNAIRPLVVSRATQAPEHAQRQRELVFQFATELNHELRTTCAGMTWTRVEEAGETSGREEPSLP